MMIAAAHMPEWIGDLALGGGRVVARYRCSACGSRGEAPVGGKLVFTRAECVPLAALPGVAPLPGHRDDNGVLRGHRGPASWSRRNI